MPAPCAMRHPVRTRRRAPMGEQGTAAADGAGPSGGGAPGRRPAGRRIGRRVGQVLLALVLVALLIWGIGLFRVLGPLPRAAQGQAGRRAADGLQARPAQEQADQGYEHVLEEFTRLAAADAEVLDAEFGAPLGTLRTVTCSVEPSDRGWFVAEHRNDCSLRELEVRAVPDGVHD